MFPQVAHIVADLERRGFRCYPTDLGGPGVRYDDECELYLEAKYTRRAGRLLTAAPLSDSTLSRGSCPGGPGKATPSGRILDKALSF